MTENPFKTLTDFDFSKFFDVTKLLSELKIPGIDMDALMEAQRKNIETLTLANRMAVEGMQSIAKRQTEIVTQSLTELNAMAKQLTEASTPQEITAKQAELIKQSFEKAITHMRELAELVNKSNSQVFEVINQRVTESLQELKGLVSSATKAKEAKE